MGLDKSKHFMFLINRVELKDEGFRIIGTGQEVFLINRVELKG